MKDWFMNLLYYLKRPLIWLSRFRYRCGYGVHSPFAFSLITDVIYEKMPYYAYDLLKAEQKKRITTQGWEKGIPRINRLLFRLVNKVQPATIIEVGQPSAASLYLQSAKPSAGYLFASDLSELFLDADTPVDFLYLNDYRNPALLEEVFNICSRRTTPNSLFVVHGICYSKAMKNLGNSYRMMSGWESLLTCMMQACFFLIQQRLNSIISSTSDHLYTLILYIVMMKNRRL